MRKIRLAEVGLCSTCAFWQYTGSDDDRGYCKRYPPTPVREDFGYNGVANPRTHAGDGCGEHRQMKEKKT